MMKHFVLGLAIVAVLALAPLSGHADLISLEGTATVSSNNTTSQASYVNDGGFVWAASSWASANVLPPHWATITWDSDMVVEQVKVYNIQYAIPTIDPLLNTRDFKIQAADGLGGWTDLATVTGNNLDVYDLVLTTPVTTDAIRLYITDPNDIAGDHYARILELEVYGTPEPATLGLLAIGGLFGVLRRRR